MCGVNRHASSLHPTTQPSPVAIRNALHAVADATDATRIVRRMKVRMLLQTAFPARYCCRRAEKSGGWRIFGEQMMSFEGQPNPGQPRVLHVASWFPSPVHASLGNFIERHIAAIGTKVPEAAVVAAVASRGPSHVAVGEVAGTNIPVVRAYHGLGRPGMVRATAALDRAVRAVRRSGFRPDLIHLHVTYPGGRAARRWAERWDVPLIVTEHWTGLSNSGPERRIPAWQLRDMRRTARRAAVVCPVSSDLALGMERRGLQSRYSIIPNVVDTAAFPLNTTPRTPHLLHVSSMSDGQKNVTGLLEAFADARPQLAAGTRLRLIGQNDLPLHRSTISRLGLEDHVDLLGGVRPDRVAVEMQAATALVLNSRYENFPCVLPEAWSSGLPVMAPDVGGIAEGLTPELGMLIPGGNASALAEAMIDIQSATFDPEVLHRHAREFYGVEAVAQAYLDVYNSCLDG